MSSSLRELSDIEYGASPKEIRANDRTQVGIYGTSGFLGYATKPLFNGPLVVVARKGTLDNPVYVEDNCWVIDTAFAVLPKRKVEGKWLYYQLSNYDLKKLNESTGVPSISRDYLYRLSFLNPGLPKQRKITRILTKVDLVIAQTEKAIEKLKSIKQGMMHDLFTRGIDVKTGKLRPPYSEAPELYKETELGWIPKEWDVKSFDETCLKVVDRDHYTPIYVDHGVLMVSPKDFKEFDLIDFTGCKCITQEEHRRNMKKTDLQAEDLVFTRIGALLGKVAIVESWMPEFSILHSACMIRTNKDKIISKYMLYFMKSDFFQNQILSDIQSIGVPDLGLEKIKKFLVSYPTDIKEQRIISTRLSNIFERLIKETDYLNKVSKIKQGLMQNLLTGRVEVTPDPEDEEYQEVS